MPKMKTTVILAIAIVITLTGSTLFACTAFMSSEKDLVLVGNNEDYYNPYTRIWFIPATNGQYGRVYFGYDDWRPQGGMNDQGLFFDAFATAPLEVMLSKDKPKFKGSFFDKFMAECATVEEALDFFNRYNLEFMLTFQLLIVDKTGDSAIIEGDRIVRKKNPYQVVTNFYQSKVAYRDIPCEWYKGGCRRYQIAENMLKENRNASFENFREILKATHQNTLGVQTLYSNIYDLKNGMIHLYYLHNYDNAVIINLNEELKKGRHYYEIPSLFGKIVSYEKTDYVHQTPKFRIVYPKHYKVVAPEADEMFRARNSFGGAPVFSVSVVDRPQDMPLREFGKKIYIPELKKSGANIRIESNIQTRLKDGSPANEVCFDWLHKSNWPVKTMVLSTYRDNRLFYVAAHSLAHAEIMKEYIYSLRFD
jgi:hypothetical protein